MSFYSFFLWKDLYYLYFIFGKLYAKRGVTIDADWDSRSIPFYKTVGIKDNTDQNETRSLT